MLVQLDAVPQQAFQLGGVRLQSFKLPKQQVGSLPQSCVLLLIVIPKFLLLRQCGELPQLHVSS